MPIRIFPGNMNHPVLQLFTKIRKKNENEFFCLNAFEWELVISHICISKGKGLIK